MSNYLGLGIFGLMLVIYVIYMVLLVKVPEAMGEFTSTFTR